MARKKNNRRSFLEVDVWRNHFGTVSVTAIYDVFMRRFNVEKHNMKNYDFSHCVEELRKLEDPNYIEGDMALCSKTTVFRRGL